MIQIKIADEERGQAEPGGLSAGRAVRDDEQKRERLGKQIEDRMMAQETFCNTNGILA